MAPRITASGFGQRQSCAGACRYLFILYTLNNFIIVDLLLFINAKNTIDLHAIQNFLIDLVVEKNIPIHTVSSDQWNGEIFLQALESSVCFTEVKKVSVDTKLEPY